MTDGLLNLSRSNFFRLSFSTFLSLYSMSVISFERKIIALGMLHDLSP